MGDDKAAPYLATGALVRVLEEWCQPFPGFFLYYPSRRQQPAALSALVNALRWALSPRRDVESERPTLPEIWPFDIQLTSALHADVVRLIPSESSAIRKLVG